MSDLVFSFRSGTLRVSCFGEMVHMLPHFFHGFVYPSLGLQISVVESAPEKFKLLIENERN